MKAPKITPLGKFSSVDEVRRWHEHMLAGWNELHGAHEREAQAHDAIAFLLGVGGQRSMDDDIRDQLIQERNLRDAVERY